MSKRKVGVNFNLSIVGGFLVKDPTIGKTRDGKPYAQFKLRVDEGDGVEEINVLARDSQQNPLATNIGRYLTEGRNVQIVGKIRSRTIDVKNVKYFIQELVAVRVDFIDDPSTAASTASDDIPLPEEVEDAEVDESEDAEVGEGENVFDDQGFEGEDEKEDTDYESDPELEKPKTKPTLRRAVGKKPETQKSVTPPAAATPRRSASPPTGTGKVNRRTL